MKIMESTEGLLNDALGGGDVKHICRLRLSKFCHVRPKDIGNHTYVRAMLAVSQELAA
jgi:hypothetical protein